MGFGGTSNMKPINRNICTVISGSYRKHLSGIYMLREVLESRGITVLSPIGSRVINPADEFAILDDDPFVDHRTLQDSVFAKIRRSAFLTSFNEDGYLGPASLIEYGYAISQGIQILTLRPVTDPNIAPYSRLLSDIIGEVDV